MTDIDLTNDQLNAARQFLAKRFLVPFPTGDETIHLQQDALIHLLALYSATQMQAATECDITGASGT